MFGYLLCFRYGVRYGGGGGEEVDEFLIFGVDFLVGGGR